MNSYFFKTKRIGFSHWKENDGDLAISLWGEPDVTRYISANGLFSEEQIKDRLTLEIENYEKYNVQYYPIFNLENDELIGCCGVRPYKNILNVYEMGFHLRKKYWHQGYGFEAASAMIEYAFSILGAEELKAGHNPNNIASKKLLTKLGFEYEADEYYEPTGLYHPTYSLKNKSGENNE